MATNGCMKAEPIPLPKKTEVFEVVEEVYVEEKMGRNDPVICRMPVTPQFDCELKPTKVKREFECEYPTVDPNVTRVRQPLPFPKKLKDVIAWTDAFVDRIASMTAAEEQQKIRDMTLLANEVERLRSALTTTQVELDKTRDAVQAADANTDAVKRELAAARAESKAQAQTIKVMHDRAAKEANEQKLLREQLKDLNIGLALKDKNIDELRKKLAKENKKVLEEHAKWEKEHKLHHEDHTVLEMLRNQCDTELKAKKEVQAALAKSVIDLANVNIALEAKEKTVEGLNAQLVAVKTELEDMKNSNAGLEQSLAVTKEKLNASEHSLEAAKAEITKLGLELAASKKHVCDLDEQLETANTTIASLNDELSALRSEKDAATTEVSKLQDHLAAAQSTIETLKSDLQTARTTTAQLESSHTEAKALAARMEKAWLAAIKARDDAAAAHDLAIHALKAQHESDIAIWRDAADVPAEKLAEYKRYQAQAEALQTHVAALEKRQLPVSPCPNSRVNILSVEYGGRAYTYASHKAVLEKLYACAEKGEAFAVENKFFEGDPWQGVKKTCCVTYVVEGEKAVRVLCAKEHEKGRFAM